MVKGTVSCHPDLETWRSLPSVICNFLTAISSNSFLKRYHQKTINIKELKTWWSCTPNFSTFIKSNQIVLSVQCSAPIMAGAQSPPGGLLPTPMPIVTFCTHVFSNLANDPEAGNYANLLNPFLIDILNTGNNTAPATLQNKIVAKGANWSLSTCHPTWQPCQSVSLFQTTGSTLTTTPQSALW